MNLFHPQCPQRLLPTLVFLGMLAILLNGCGFHLRGMVNLPTWLDRVAIINHSGNRTIEQALKAQLNAYDVQTAQDPGSARYWLVIERDLFQEQIGSISSSTTPRQYQLFYRVTFHLQDAKGNLVIPTAQVLITRKITMNMDRILGSNDEQAITQKEMIRDAATQILNRLSKH